jgi:hypothetical protein
MGKLSFSSCFRISEMLPDVQINVNKLTDFYLCYKITQMSRKKLSEEANEKGENPWMMK